MNFPEYELFDGLGLAELVKKGEVSSLELIESAIARIENKNPKINAVIFKMYDEARATAQQPIPNGLFQGVPFLLKDILADCEGSPMHCGSSFMQGYLSQNDSELVRRYKKAGLIILGKTNLPEFGLSPVTEPELFGPTCNPWDLAKNAGGSSGGSAAAVASCMVPMAHGGDGAGSLRIPAAYCGVFGLKPSRGRTPTGPHLMRVWQGMVVEHAITRSVRDSAALLDISAGKELGSLISLPDPEKSFLSCLTKPIKPLRIAYTSKAFFGCVLHPEYDEALTKAAKLCEHLGHSVEWNAPSIYSEEVALAFLIIIAADMAFTLKLIAKKMRCKPDYGKLEPATAVLCEVGEHFSAEDFAWANYTLDQTVKQMAEFFQNYDVMLTPTMADPPPAIGEFKPDRLEQNIIELLRRLPYGPILKRLTRKTASQYFGFTPYTPIFNITGQPAMSVPLYWDKNGLPIGIHFAARIGEESVLLQLAQQLEGAKPAVSLCP